MGVLTQLNLNDGTTDINANLLPNIPGSLLPNDLLTDTDGLFDLANARVNPFFSLRDHDFLQYNADPDVDMWENVPATQFLGVNTMAASGGGSLSYSTVRQEFDFAPAVIPTVSGLPTAPTDAARYELEVDSSGDAEWMEIEAGGATVSDTAPTDPSAGDLWYYTGGDDEAGNEPGLFVYYDDGTTSNWTSTTSMYTVPAAPTGLTDDTSYNLQVTSGGEASWEPVADSGGGSSGGSAPTGSTFISSSATVFGSTNATIITLTADASSNSTFYVVGGTNKLHRTQDATANDAQARLFVGGIDHIVAGRGTVVFQNNTLHTYSGAFNIRDRTNMVWNDTEKYFIGRGSTLDQIPASNTRMGTGSGSPTGFAISGTTLHELQAYNGNSRQVNGGIIEAGGGFDFEVTVTAGQTAFFALTEPTNSNVSAEFYATRLN